MRIRLFSSCLSKIRTMASSAAERKDIESELIRSFLALEKIDVNIFRALSENLWQPFRSRFIFGGQVVGQALAAACRTVSQDHQVHSLHCYFLRGGNSHNSILYHVDRTRDGATYTSRSVKATQDGMPIFTMQSSFKVNEEQEYRYQMEMPTVPGPEDLLDEEDSLKAHLEDEILTDKEKEFINRSFAADNVPVHIRPVDSAAFFRFKVSEPKRFVWMKAVGHIGDDPKVHQCVAAYLSDFSLLGTSTQPAGPNYVTNFMTSLDHTVWFHNPFQVNEWMLYEYYSPQCGNGRALCHGRVWRRDGVLAMSVAQEGVVRNTPKPKM